MQQPVIKSIITLRLCVFEVNGHKMHCGAVRFVAACYLLLSNDRLRPVVGFYCRYIGSLCMESTASCDSALITILMTTGDRVCQSSTVTCELLALAMLQR